ncbi:MAG: hypothetical protein J0L97_05435 [Alphaproteobacteria bacterium]|nr:hypothetical protein [Alphaproteobacteria bacterium]
MKTLLKTSLAIAAMFAASTALAQSGATSGSSATSGASTQPGASTSTTTGNTTGPGTTANTNTGARSTDGSSAASVNWDAENTYWRDNYRSRPYFNTSRSYSEMSPAYRYGWDLYDRSNSRAYNDLDQEQLRKNWEQARGDSNLDWNTAEPAIRDAYNRRHNNRNM